MLKQDKTFWVFSIMSACEADDLSKLGERDHLLRKEPRGGSSLWTTR